MTRRTENPSVVAVELHCRARSWIASREHLRLVILEDVIPTRIAVDLDISYATQRNGPQTQQQVIQFYGCAFECNDKIRAENEWKKTSALCGVRNATTGYKN